MFDKLSSYLKSKKEIEEMIKNIITSSKCAYNRERLENLSPAKLLELFNRSHTDTKYLHEKDVLISGKSTVTNQNYFILHVCGEISYSVKGDNVVVNYTSPEMSRHCSNISVIEQYFEIDMLKQKVIRAWETKWEDDF